MAPRSLPISKKRKLGNEDSALSDTTATIKNLEDQLIAAVSNKSSLNPLADLLDIARTTADAQILSKAIYALYRVFVVVISNGLLLNVAGNDETKAVRAWIQEKLRAYVDLLTGLLKDVESLLKVRSLNNFLRIFYLTLRVDIFSQDIIVAAEAPLDVRQQGPRLQHGYTPAVLCRAFQADCQRTAPLSALFTGGELDEEAEKRRERG